MLCGVCCLSLSAWQAGFYACWRRGWSGGQQDGDGNPERPRATPSYSYWALVIFLLAGTLLTPSVVLGGGYNTYDCGGDVIASYEAAGAHLAQNIPPGSSVYWKGSLSTVPLLYVPGIRIFPAQINDGYSFSTAR